MKKLLFINQTLAFGGAEIFNSDLLTWLKNTKNWEVCAYVTQPRLHDVLVKNGIISHHITTIVDLIGDWKGLIKGVILLPVLLFQYIRIINEHKDANIVFMTGFIEKILITPLAKLFNIPVVWLEFAPLESIFKKFFGLPRLLYHLVENLPYRVIVPTQNTANHLLQTTRIPASKIVVVPLGRTISKMSKSPISAGLVVCVSRLEPGKGQDYLLRAWVSVQKQIPAARLMVVGEGDFDTALTALSHDLSLEKTVKFTGRVADSELQHLISMAQVCVFSTLWPLEGFGLVAVEAMAAGKPVVGFNFGPVPEIITDQTGILVPPGDVSALAQAIIKLLNHPDLGEKMGAAGIHRYQNTYTFAKIGPKYVEVFTTANQSV